MVRKKEMKIIGYSALLLISSSVVGLLLLCLVYMLPTEPMKERVKYAYDLFMDERVSHDWANAVEFTRLDGYTDMIMYGTAIYDGEEGVLTEALLNRRMDKRGEERMDLADYISGQPGTYEPQSYERYWHGYLIWLKPLLLVMHPRNIRVFNMILQIFVLAYFLQLLAVKFNRNYFIPFIAGIIIINPVSTAMCLQYSSIYYISLIAMILALKSPQLLQKKTGFSLFFLGIGICVAYFDFLTYPPVALCLPLFVYLCLRSSDENTDYEQTKVASVFRAGIYWSVGYVGMWGFKWVLPLLVGVNQFAELFYEIGFRTDLGSNSLVGLLIEKISVIAIKPFIFFFMFVIAYMFITAIRSIKKGKICFVAPDLLISYILVGLIPFGWYFGARQHSSHTFAYRDIVGTIMSILFIIEEFTLVNQRKCGRAEECRIANRG